MGAARNRGARACRTDRAGRAARRVDGFGVDVGLSLRGVAMKHVFTKRLLLPTSARTSSTAHGWPRAMRWSSPSASPAAAGPIRGAAALAHHALELHALRNPQQLDAVCEGSEAFTGGSRSASACMRSCRFFQEVDAASLDRSGPADQSTMVGPSADPDRRRSRTEFLFASSSSSFHGRANSKSRLTTLPRIETWVPHRRRVRSQAMDRMHGVLRRQPVDIIGVAHERAALTA